MNTATVNEKLEKILEKLEKLDTLENKVDSIKERFAQEIDTIKSEIHLIKENCSRTENISVEKDRKLNLLIFGIQGKNFFTINRESMNVLKFLVPEINENYIADIWKTNKSKENSPVIVKLNSSIVKTWILKKKHTLRGETRFKHIQIKEDLSKDVRETRKLLFPHLIRLKENGEKVIMMKDKLKVNGNILSLEELNKQETTTKRARSEETSPKIQEERNTWSHSGGQAKKKERKTARHNSLDRFFRKGLEENSTKQIVRNEEERGREEEERKTGNEEKTNTTQQS
ncbi:hypothetical protein LSTR_LSTR010893 [Laodelphax striatellus]|uniref:Endonuclease-reverse transcriptase n=1 Tax=Laodelphax striatellus TaxID=195883 RepID=A0A482XLW0_LAOST|nr:hypothetical protein LSTR_LSTR010893 [Laodelphax striatellus]